MHWFYAPGYDYGRGIPGVPPAIHGFILNKPTEIRNSLVSDGVVTAAEMHVPQPIRYEDLRRVHNDLLIERLSEPTAVARAIELDEIAALPKEIVRTAVVEPQLLASGGTYEALRLAMLGKWAVNLSGGYHHAREALSHGFCLVNDVAAGLARLRHEGLSRRVLIIDLDLHQGDGNATIFRDDADVYTVSIHEEGIFPVPKMQSDLDIGLAAGTEDTDYLAAVEDRLRQLELEVTQVRTLDDDRYYGRVRDRRTSLPPREAFRA